MGPILLPLKVDTKILLLSRWDQKLEQRLSSNRTLTLIFLYVQPELQDFTLFYML